MWNVQNLDVFAISILNGKYKIVKFSEWIKLNDETVLYRILLEVFFIGGIFTELCLCMIVPTFINFSSFLYKKHSTQTLVRIYNVFV